MGVIWGERVPPDGVTGRGTRGRPVRFRIVLRAVLGLVHGRVR